MMEGTHLHRFDFFHGLAGSTWSYCPCMKRTMKYIFLLNNIKLLSLLLSLLSINVFSFVKIVLNKKQMWKKSKAVEERFDI